MSNGRLFLVCNQLDRFYIGRYCAGALAVLLLVIPGFVMASAPAAPPVTPQVMHKSPATQQNDPQVVIRSGSDGQMEEYRMGGQLYMVKISPKKGRPYYLVDTDGDGSFETRRSELGGDVLIPQWPLLKWK